jgi:hypothetical protein
MAHRSTSFGILVALFLAIVSWSGAVGQSSTPSTENDAWPEADAHMQLRSNWRLLPFVGLEQAAGYPFQQWYVAAGIGRQLKTILRPHWENIFSISRITCA